MFKVGDSVLYGSAGICRIEKISQMDFGAGKEDYYVLKKPEKNDSAIYVPLGNDRLLGKMRYVLSVDEVNELIIKISETEPLWIENEAERKSEYKKVIDGGEREHIICVMKALIKHKQQLKSEGKKLHVADERFLKEAEEMLSSEIAYVLDISSDEARKMINRAM